MQAAGQRRLQQRITAKLIAGRQETDQTQCPRLGRGADRLRERFLVLRVEHVDSFRKICRCVRDQGAHVSAGRGIGSQNL